MNELDKSSPTSQTGTQLISPELPDLTEYGYQALEELSAYDNRQRITYLARDLNFQRVVVIKQWCRLNPATATLDYPTYLPKIELLKKLDYPNIPRYLNSFAIPTGFCLVREYQRGTPLTELGTLPASDIKLIAKAVLKILGYLHQLQPIIIHQNIKPENIIVDTESELTVYLVDLGLNIPELEGTPGFVPPEQLFSHQTVTASDNYSLGVTLICLLTGTATAQAKDLLDRNHRPQFKNILPDNIHPQLVKWLEKMVEPNYQKRYLDAASARYQIIDLPTERPKNKILSISPNVKGEWLRWGIVAVVLIGIALIVRQLIATDTNDINPAEIARNQAITKQAAFDESDRGQLLKQKQCIKCNLSTQDFSKAELSSASLTESNLTGANFSGANLNLSIFRDADLSQANFTKANLHQAAFYGAKLIGTDLTGANLSQAKLVYAKLKGAILRNANLSNADLKFAELPQVDLGNANLANADLTNADLSYANLKGANLSQAKLDGANLSGATMPDGSMHK